MSRWQKSESMNRKVAMGLLVIVACLAALMIMFSQKEQQVSCIGGDGFCPNGCTYPQDTDCQRSAVTTSGEIRRCIVASDCVTVTPICNNEQCNFNDAECLSSCSCGVAINKDYENVFKNTNTICKPSGIACIKCSDTPPNVICINGACSLQSIS